MRTELLKEDLRPPWSRSFLVSAHRAAYGEAPKRSRGTLLHGLPFLLENYWLLTDPRRVALELDDASRLPTATRHALLDELVPVALDWLLDVAERVPAAYDLQRGGDDKIYARIRDACAECQAAADAVLWPAVSPQFCSKECALSWIEDRADDVPRFADFDEELREAVEKAELEAAEKAEEEAAEEYAGFVDPDSDDNPIMDVVRRYSEPDPTLTAGIVAWRLETAFRAGMRL